MYVVSQFEILFFNLILKEPADKPVNTFDACQVVPPSFEYWRFDPVAFTVIVPSFNAGQLLVVGSVFDTEEIVGVAG